MKPRNKGIRTVYRTGPIHRFLSDLSFGTSDVGWCIGTQNVLLTTDMGLTWRNLYVDEATLPFAEPRRVVAIGENCCWLLGLFNGGLCRTVDQGRTWRYVDLAERVVLDDFDVLDDQIAVIGTKRDASRDRVTVFAGFESGERWQELAPQIIGEPRKIRFAANSSMVILSVAQDSAGQTSSHIYRALDFGSAWKSAFSINSELLGVGFVRGNGLILFGESGVIKSADDANEFDSVWRSREGEFVNAVHVGPTGVGIGVTSQGGVLLTQNYGDSWNRYRKSYDEELIAVNLLTETSALILGEESINILTF